MNRYSHSIANYINIEILQVYGSIQKTLIGIFSHHQVHMDTIFSKFLGRLTPQNTTIAEVVVHVVPQDQKVDKPVFRVVHQDPKIDKKVVDPTSQASEHLRRFNRSARHRYERPSVINLATNETPQQFRTQPDKQIHASKKIQEKVLADVFESHNHYRAKHSVPALAISERLNIIAQKYAEHLAATSKFEHSKNKVGKESLGENLHMQYVTFGKVPVDGKQTVKDWYSENGLYNYKHPKYSEDTGHFTQMIWQASQKMGVGVALSANEREVYIVTNYYPAGNITNDGYFEKNVLPAKH